jgi:hypothetical protein
MIRYKDCPECGARKIHDTVRLCEICETCEKYESKIAEALRERDELKARLAHAEADAEQAIHNEAFMERQRIVDWIRVRATRDSKGPEASFRELAVMFGVLGIAKEIERGEHEE